MNSTQRFGRCAKAYAAFRPSYPAGAIEAVLEGLGDPAALTIADVGAGTGISSRLFADRGPKIIAIEPNEQMRAAAALHPRVQWHNGNAERTGLRESSVDAVVACQAFHWFATAAAMGEFRRIARRRAAILQYERDERDDFTRAYGEIVRFYATDDTEAMRLRALTIFERFPAGRVKRSEHSSVQRLDRDALLGRASSASYLPAAGPDAERLRTDLRALFAGFAGGGYVELAIVTYALVADW
ncbi:MAG: class I SAM-dependent methyltransferase [Candidatus Eremiobacteraeota bacterium]|nr:class I SAM-dependent methyltransferase [Candidatus Eremiobacteraeota bacterium]